MSYKVRVFIVTFNNSKKRKPGTPHQQYDAVGVEFQRTKHIALDTTYLPRNTFRNLEEMREFLGTWGRYEITWMDEAVTV